MDITNFSEPIRVGSSWPAVVDIKKLYEKEHEECGVVASAYFYRPAMESGYLKVLLDEVHSVVYLVNSRYNEPLPEQYRGLSVLYSSKK